jgi:hypothetical protein
MRREYSAAQSATPSHCLNWRLPAGRRQVVFVREHMRLQATKLPAYGKRATPDPGSSLRAAVRAYSELIRHTEVERVADTVLIQVEGVIAVRESDARDVDACIARLVERIYPSHPAEPDDHRRRK